MAKKKLNDVEARNAWLDTVNALKITATNEVSFTVEKKKYIIPSVKINHGLVKKLNWGDETSVPTMLTQLWEKQVAKIDGLEDILDELDWEEVDGVIEKFIEPIMNAVEEVEKKYS